ncbi:MAG: pyruvate, phosphate dikinase, partial [Spirochaetota bacterium]
MKKNIHFFRRNEPIKDESIIEKIGLRGKLANEFAALDLPILPGFIIDADIASHLEAQPLTEHFKDYLKKLEDHTSKVFGDPVNPLVLKIVISPNLAIINYPTLHNFGLTDATIPGFNSFVGENFGYHEIQFLLNGMLEIETKIAEIENRTKDVEKLKKQLEFLQKEMKEERKVAERIAAINTCKPFLPEGFFSDAQIQLEISLKRISKMLDLDELIDNDAALIIQP